MTRPVAGRFGCRRHSEGGHVPGIRSSDTTWLAVDAGGCDCVDGHEQIKARRRPTDATDSDISAGMSHQVRIRPACVPAMVQCVHMSSDTLTPADTDRAVTTHTLIDSPVGALWATSRGGRITGLRFTATQRVEPEADWVSDPEPFAGLRRQLEEYFAGERRCFDVHVEAAGTEFQMQVWSALRDIPYGETATYGEIAEAIGRPTAVRAVGGANNANSIPIVIPCHRVIGANGTLTGFGGGLDAKATLLDLEARVSAG